LQAKPLDICTYSAYDKGRVEDRNRDTGGNMRMARGFGKKNEWRAEAARVLAVVRADPWWIGKEIDSAAELRWRADWTTVATENNLKIQHRTGTWADSTFGAKSVWRVMAR